ncbi:MAG TPA: NAD-dependent epimerase/dehydratase family protein [Acidimicrobiales bacterium]
MRPLVTRDAGHIGSVVARILEEWYHVTVFDDLSKGYRDMVPAEARFEQGRNHDTARVIDGAGFEAVVHRAAFSRVAESVEHPARYEENSVLGTGRLCNAMLTPGINKVIVSPSAAVYGESGVAIITEETKTAPVNPYGGSNLAIDNDLSRRTHAGERAAINRRHFNVAGAYGSYRGRHRQETHLVPVALEVATGKRASLTIFDDDLPTSDATRVGDYIHVRDIANAHVPALAAQEAGQHDIVNLGNSSSFSVQDVPEGVLKVTGHPLPTKIHPRRAGTPDVLVVSNERARTHPDWIPVHPDVTTMGENASRFVPDRAA